MKKLLLGLLSIWFGSIISVAQVCTPDPLYTDSTFGAWPDTIVNFVVGDVNTAYSQVLDFKVPSNASEVDAQLPSTILVDSFDILGITGLPIELNYACGNVSCFYLGGEQGCLEISGTPLTQGSFDVVINSIAHGTTPLGVSSVSYDFTGYVINIDAVGIVEIKEQDFFVTQNSPNPFRGRTEIMYYAKETSDMLFELYDMLGKKIYSEIHQPTFGQNTIEFNARNTPAGIYMYTLIQGDRIVTKKMTIAGE